MLEILIELGATVHPVHYVVWLMQGTFPLDPLLAVLSCYLAWGRNSASETAKA